MKVYIAGPLFCDAEKAFNERIDAVIRACGHETYLPQRDGGKFAELPELVEGRPKAEWLHDKDIDNLEWCDVFLFLMDGRIPDEGACVALGYAYARGKKCVGYKTDARTSIAGADNLMITASMAAILRDEAALKAYFEAL